MSVDSVPVEAVLDCLTRLLAIRRAGPVASAAVLPVVLAERARWTPLISAAFEQAGAPVVDATACGGGVPSGDVNADAPELAAEVTALLDRYNASEPGADLRLVLTGGTARIDGALEYDSVNRGQQAVREIAAAICHEDLRAADTAALITAEDALDARHVGEVWRLLMDLPRLLALRQGAQIALFAGDASTDLSGPHFTGPVSARYILDRRGLRTRRPWAHNRAAVAELAPHSQADMPLVVMFLGAGASTSAGLPLGNKLRDTALEHLTGEPVSPDTAVEVAERWFDELAGLDQLSPGEHAAGRRAFAEGLTLERVLAVEQYREGSENCHTLREFRRDHALVRNALAAQAAAGAFADDPLVRLLAARRRLVLVTVNFDQVVEIKAGADVRPFVTDDDFAALPGYLDEYAANGGPVPLIKMHGDIDVPTSIVANLDQTQAGLSLARSNALTALVERVRQQEVRPWWYVGYSMRDRDLENVWTGGAFADSMTERWVSPTVDPSVRDFIDRQRRPRWTGAARAAYTADERTITTTAADFYALLLVEVAGRW